MQRSSHNDSGLDKIRGSMRHRNWLSCGPVAGFLLLFAIAFACNCHGDVKLTSSIIGTSGTWCSGNTVTNDFAGNTNTSFDAPDPGNGDCTGLDFDNSLTNMLS